MWCFISVFWFKRAFEKLGGKDSFWKRQLDTGASAYFCVLIFRQVLELCHQRHSLKELDRKKNAAP